MNQDQCFLLPQSPESISVRRTAAMGDCIAATVVCDRLADMGYQVTYACHNTFHGILKLHPKIRQLKDQNHIASITLDKAYEDHPQRRARSFTELFIEAANRHLAARGVSLSPLNGTPGLTVNTVDRLAASAHFKNYGHPWVIINPRASGFWHNRHVPNWVWQETVRRVEGTCFWMGQDPAPTGIIDLHCRTPDILPSMLANADLVVSVDTGPMHLAAAIGKPVLAINQSSSPDLHLTDQRDFEMVSPGLDCLNCQLTVCPKNSNRPPCQEVHPELIAQAINRKLRSIFGEDVTAVIAAYRPSASMLRKCLEAVMPQVSETIITVDAAGTLPPGIPNGVRVVKTRLPNIGVGRNYNHGFRHSHGRYILMLNDDMYLKPDAVQRMKECLKTGVGLVGNLSHYPDGTIYHAGKIRSPNGGIGHTHLDYRKHRPTITQPCEVENVNLASGMFRREAFYSVLGFDERFFMYAEDDDMCMRLRRAGWKVWYTPYADGIHDEHQETKNFPRRTEIMMQSNALFGALWGDYFRHNKGNHKLGDFAYA